MEGLKKIFAFYVFHAPLRLTPRDGALQRTMGDLDHTFEWLEKAYAEKVATAAMEDGTIPELRAEMLFYIPPGPPGPDSCG